MNNGNVVHKRKLWKFFIPAIVWSVTIFITSSIPGYALPDISIWSWDKWVHVSVFGLLAFLAIIGFEAAASYYNRTKYWVIVWVISICILYAATDEWHQWYVPNRSCEWLDFWADTIGITIVGVSYGLNLPPFGKIRKFIYARIEPLKRTAF